MYSSVVTTPNALKRALHAAWHTSGPPCIATTNASALGTGSHLRSEVVLTGGPGVLTREKATAFYLKFYSRDDGLPVGDPTRRSRKVRSPRGSFPGPARCAHGGKRQRHGAPRLPQPGLSSGRSELRVRAGRGGRSRRAQRARGRHPPPGRAPDPTPARGGAERAGARRLAPPPAPPTPSHAFSPPLSLPAKGGPRREARRRRGPAQAQCRPGRGRGGRAAQASPPQHSAQQRSVETLGR